MLLSFALSTATLRFVWRRHRQPGARPLLALMAGVGLWILAYGVEVAGASYSIKLLGARLKYCGILLVPTMWLLFVLQYTGHMSWPRRWAALLAVEPAAVLALVWSFPASTLYWARVTIDRPAGYAVLLVDPGPGFWIHTAYSYVLLLYGLAVLVWELVYWHRLRRPEMATVLVALVGPWSGNVLSLFGLNPFPYLDLTPLAFCLTGLALAWALFRYHILEPPTTGSRP